VGGYGVRVVFKDFGNYREETDWAAGLYFMGRFARF
jgi:hypothetical protein